MATRPTRPKGYLTKGKTTSMDAARKSTARKELTSLRGIAGLVGRSVVEGIGGPKARAGKVIVRAGRGISSRVSKEVEQVVNKSARGNRTLSRATASTRNVRNPIPNKKRPLPQRMKQTTTGQPRKKVSDKVATAMAKESAGPKAKAPFGRAPKVSKPAVGRILTKSEKARDAYYKSKQNPVNVRQGKRKVKEIKSQAQKDFERRLEIRKAISGKPGKRAPEAPPTTEKPLRNVTEILKPLKGKYVVTGTTSAGQPIKMSAEEYVLTKVKMKGATQNPKNSVAPRTRAQEKARADAAEATAIKEARVEEVMQRLREIKDTQAAKTNPRRYSSPAQERGNVRQTEGLIAQGEKRIQEETTRRRIEQEKIARTPKRQKEVEATLMRQKNREAILSETRKKATITRRVNSPKPVKPGRTRRAK